MATLGIMVGIATLTPFGSNPHQQTVSDSQQVAERQACIADYTKCKDNADLVDYHLVERHERGGGVDVPAACEAAAQREASYESAKFSRIPFGEHVSGRSYVDTGHAILIEPDAQFQDGFGAYRHVSVKCDYDLQADSAYIEITERSGNSVTP